MEEHVKKDLTKVVLVTLVGVILILLIPVAFRNFL